MSREGNGNPLQYSYLENPMDGRLQSMESRRVWHSEWLHFHFSLSCIGEGNGSPLLCSCREGNGNPLQCSCLENPRDGEPCRLLSMGSHRVRHDWSNLAAAAAASVLAWRIPGTEEPCRLPPMGSHRFGHDWSDLAAAAVHYEYPGLS